MTETQLKNLIAFLCIIFSENEEMRKEILMISPDYLIEKYECYILSDKNESDWGMHPYLRGTLFNAYCNKWGISMDNQAP